jgi:2-polyprenyl-3-methyl-5-hydroxy-6-metoxy-1,4-benzoquinol methylase
MSAVQEKTSRQHWDQMWTRAPRLRLPSPWIVSTGDRIRLLQSEIKPGMHYLEIGCAPGKMLAYTAKRLEAKVAGLDYSPQGLAWTRRLFESLGLESDLRCESVFNTSFEAKSFDVVHSAGVIEHFEDPAEIVRIHVELLRPGGVALITIPNLVGCYRRAVEYFDTDVVSLHNLKIMNRLALASLAPPDLADQVSAYPFGRVSFDFVHFHRKFPPKLAATMFYLSNVVGLVQPAQIDYLCPHLVLRIVRKRQPHSS